MNIELDALVASEAKMIENNIFHLRAVLKDKFTATSKKNKDRFDRLDRVLRNYVLNTMARKIRICTKYTDDNPTGQTTQSMIQLGDVITIIKV